MIQVSDIGQTCPLVLLIHIYICCGYSVEVPHQGISVLSEALHFWALTFSTLLQVLTTEYNPEEWSKETEDLMTEPIPEQPGTNVDTKDTSVDAPSPPPQEGKVSSTTPGKTEDAKQRVPSAVTKEPSRSVASQPPPKEPTRGGSEGTEVRQRKSTSR